MSTYGISGYVQNNYPPNEWAQEQARLNLRAPFHGQQQALRPSPLSEDEATGCCKATACFLVVLFIAGGVVATSVKREVVLIAVESSLAVMAICAIATCCRVQSRHA